MCERLAAAQGGRRTPAPRQPRRQNSSATASASARSAETASGPPTSSARRSTSSSPARASSPRATPRPRRSPRARAIADQVRRMTAMIRRLLDFARRRTVDHAPWTSRDVAARAVALLAPVTRKADVEVALRAERAQVASVDALQIQQVLCNLLLNAVQAMPGGGRVEVAVAGRRARPAEAGGAARRWSPSRSRDEGAGIAPENLLRVFGTLLHHQGRGRGTGLRALGLRRHRPRPRRLDRRREPRARGCLHPPSARGRGRGVRLIALECCGGCGGAVRCAWAAVARPCCPLPPPPIARPGARRRRSRSAPPAGCGYVVHLPLAGTSASPPTTRRPGARPPPPPHRRRRRRPHLRRPPEHRPSAAPPLRYRPRAARRRGRAREGFSLPAAGRRVGSSPRGPPPAVSRRRWAYEYAVEGAQPAAAWHFRTAPDGPEPCHGPRRATRGRTPRCGPRWPRAAREAPDVFLFTGDAVADGGSMALWARFFRSRRGAAPRRRRATGSTATTRAGRGVLRPVRAARQRRRGSPGALVRRHVGPLRVVGLNDVTVPERDGRGARSATSSPARCATSTAPARRGSSRCTTSRCTDAEGHRPDAVTRRAGPAARPVPRRRRPLGPRPQLRVLRADARRRDGRRRGAGTRYFVFGGAGAPLYPFLARGPWVHHREVTHGTRSPASTRAA